MTDRVHPSQPFTTPMPTVHSPREAIEKAFEAYIGIDHIGAAPKRISVGWYVPLRDGGEVLIPDVAFAGCGTDHRKIRVVLDGFSCAYHEGRRGNLNRLMTQTTPAPSGSESSDVHGIAIDRVIDAAVGHVDNVRIWEAREDLRRLRERRAAS